MFQIKYTSRLLMYASLVMPFNIAFIPDESKGLEIWNYMVDGLFFLDLLINIFTAYQDEDGELITNR